jgi:hypothetical protein
MCRCAERRRAVAAAWQAIQGGDARLAVNRVAYLPTSAVEDARILLGRAVTAARARLAHGGP